MKLNVRVAWLNMLDERPSKQRESCFGSREQLRIEQITTMKISLLTATICIGFGSMITTAYGQIHAFDASPLKKKLDGLQKGDFENLPESSPLLQPSLPNPMTIDGVTFTDPAFLHTGFSSSPTCL